VKPRAPVACSAPARANLIGNPSDQYGGTTLACSVPLRAHVALEPAEGTRLATEGEEIEIEKEAELSLAGDLFDVARAVLASLPGPLPAARIAYRSEVPLGSGLGGSTALVVALLRALLAWRGEAAEPPHLLAERARDVERRFLGVTCGYVDQYLAVFGGCQYVDFRGKTPEGSLASEPFATVEAVPGPLPFVLAFTGRRHSSDSVHRPIRARWLADEPGVRDATARMAELGLAGKRALLERDWARLGRLMNENHARVRDLGGSGDANERLIAAALASSLTINPAADLRLTLATWNLEWMMLPSTFDTLADECDRSGRRQPGSVRAIPCDIVPDKRWSIEDLARIRQFVSRLPLDVVALQETDGPGVAAQLFPDHEFCFTKRRHVQNVGFAIRRGIPHRCNADYHELGLADSRVRWGADITLYPGTQREIRLLSVHLKSGCGRDPLNKPEPDCRILQEQVPVLERWIDKRAERRESFAVLGDFNRRFDVERRDEARDPYGRVLAMWPELDDGEPAESDLTNAGSEMKLIGCGNGQGMLAPIDHMIFSRWLARRLVPDSFRAWRYKGSLRWPDHCLLSVELEVESRHGV